MFNWMPFGICSAPVIWQQTMDNFSSRNPAVICYLDDIVVGKNEKQHEQRLLTVLRRLDEAGIRLKQEKR